MSVPANSSLPQSGSVVSRWLLDEESDGSGAVTREDNVGSNDLTDNNTTESGDGFSSGVSMVDLVRAAVFNDTDNNYLSITDAAQSGLNPSGSLTVSFLLNWNFDENNVFVSKYKSSTDNAYLIQNDGSSDALELVMRDSGGTNYEFEGTSAIPEGIWTLCTVVFEAGSRITFYLNGSVDKNITAGIPSDVFDSSAEFNIGGVNGSGDLGARMNDCIFWDTALTDAEVDELNTLYNEATTTSTTTSTSSSTTVSTSTSFTGTTTSTSTTVTSTSSSTTTSTSTTLAQPEDLYTEVRQVTRVQGVVPVDKA